MPKGKKEESEVEDSSVEEKSVEDKKDKRKNKKSTATPKKSKKDADEKPTKKGKKSKKEDEEDDIDNDNDELDENDEGEGEKGKKGKKNVLKIAAVKKILKTVRRDISQLKIKVNKRPYKKYFEEAARSPAEFASIIGNIDMIVVQLGKYEEATKRKASYRYLKAEVVEFMNKFPISEDQPTIETIEDTGRAVSNKDMVSKYLHKYLKEHCTKENTGDASGSAFSSIVYVVDKPLKKLIKTLSGNEESDTLPFSKISTVGAMCTFKDINPLDEDIEKYSDVLDWFSKYTEPEPEKGEPKKRGRKPKAKVEEEEKKEDKKEEKKDKKEKKTNKTASTPKKDKKEKKNKKKEASEDEESF